MSGIPPSRCAQMLESMDDPLDTAYRKVVADRAREKQQQVRAGTIGLLMRLFVHAAILKGDDTVYLFSGTPWSSLGPACSMTHTRKSGVP